MIELLEDDLRVIEAQYPHIAKSLRLMWGHPEVDAYVIKLLDDCRTGVRHGFSDDVMGALLNIQEVHQPLAPNKQVDDDSPWGEGRELFKF